MSLSLRSLVWLSVTVIALPLMGQGEPAPVAVETEGPAQLLERGRQAFAESNFAEAEEALEKFIADYGEAEEAREAARLHRPLVAISKVGVKKFDEALVWIEQSLADPKLDAALEDELSFWKGICLMTAGELVEAQRAFGEYWADETHQPFKRYEALILFATLYIQQEFPAEAADFLADQLPKYRAKAPEAASRAIVLEMYARIEAGQLDQALTLLRREFPNLDQMTQLISYQTLALQLGAQFLEKERWYDAITCLQRIWPSAKLMDHQAAKVIEIEERIEVLKQRPNTQATVHQLEAILKRVRRELDKFATIENFDSALRLRLAMAYRGLGRYREAALVMAQMLESMPPDAVVESATLAQIQCWMEIGAWERAAEAADQYIEIFRGEGKNLAMVLFLRAQSLREAQEYGAAQIAYGELVEEFPDDELAPKAMFMQGFLYLQQGDNEGALYQFDQVQRLYPDSGVKEDADYWTGMADSFSGLYEGAREHLLGYLERYETPKYQKEALFRIGVCTFSLGDYEGALNQLEAFNEKYAGDDLTDEGNLLIGDAYFSDGKSDEGLAAYDRVRPQAGRYFEEAWFKKGNALKLLEDYGAMRAHFETFVQQHPGSNRLPEAVYWIGWTYNAEGDNTRAREIYWETIKAHGSNPDMVTITDVFSALPGIYANDGEAGREELLTRLERLKSGASVDSDFVMATRVGWAKSLIMENVSPVAGRTELLGISKWVNPKLNRPNISVAVAEALLDAGNPLTAKDLFTETRRWNPRCTEKARIYRGLGDIALEEGDSQKALDYYAQYEREALQSVALGVVKVRKAEIYADLGQKERARAELESVLETPGVTAESKANSLMKIGELYAGDGEHEKAIVYFERVYVAYGKFGEVNAKAYWGRGQSLEALDLKKEALETYEELVARDDLSRYDEVTLAEEKVTKLRRFLPVEKVEAEEGTL